MSVDFEKVICDKAEETRKTFRALLDKTNQENPLPKDVRALADLLSGNRKLELWRDVLSAGHLAELMVIENARATAGLKECWKHRLQTLKKELGSEGAPLLEQLLIQHWVVLAQTQARRVELFWHHDAINNSDARSLLGEAIERRTETIHKSW